MDNTLLPNKNQNIKKLRELENAVLDFLPSFLLEPSITHLMSFVIKIKENISQENKHQILMKKILSFAPPPGPHPVCVKCIPELNLSGQATSYAVIHQPANADLQASHDIQPACVAVVQSSTPEHNKSKLVACSDLLNFEKETVQ